VVGGWFLPDCLQQVWSRRSGIPELGGRDDLFRSSAAVCSDRPPGGGYRSCWIASMRSDPTRTGHKDVPTWDVPDEGRLLTMMLHRIRWCAPGMGGDCNSQRFDYGVNGGSTSDSYW